MSAQCKKLHRGFRDLLAAAIVFICSIYAYAGSEFARLESHDQLASVDGKDASAYRDPRNPIRLTWLSGPVDVYELTPGQHKLVFVCDLVTGVPKEGPGGTSFKNAPIEIDLVMEAGKKYAETSHLKIQRHTCYPAPGTARGTLCRATATLEIKEGKKIVASITK